MGNSISRGGRRATGAWVLYDWAYAAFNTIVSTFVFAAYYTQAVASDPVRGQSEWAATQAAAGILVALLSVPLGAIADSGGRRRPMLAAATVIMTLATLALWTVRPHAGHQLRALTLVLLATVAYEVATVFYNAMLPGLAVPGRLGRLSMLAWSAGYGGGLVCLGLCLVLLVTPDPALFGLDRASAEHVRACAILAGLWLAAFSWPCLVFVPEPGSRVSMRQAIRKGTADLRAVLSAAWRDPVLSRFLLARLFYTDGLTTLFAFGGIYAAGEFGLGPQQVLRFGIGLQVTAGLGALAFAFLEDRIGSKTTVMTAVLGLSALGTAVLLVHDSTVFWVIGIALGLFIGPAQAASRGMMARMAPADQRAAWFGLFALSGRVTGFVGPLTLGAVTVAFGSQRAGMAVIVVLLLLGAAILSQVKERGTAPG